MGDRAPSTLYTAYYCEENVYHLLDGWAAAGSDARETWAVLVSNHGPAESRKVLWACQRVADPMHWDYHVVALARDDQGVIKVYDVDSTLPWGCRLDEYLRASLVHTLPSSRDAPPGPNEALRSLFRCVPAASYLARFSSDRSHMIGPGGQYFFPAPPWPAICGADAPSPHSLWTHWLDMDLRAKVDKGFGVVRDDLDMLAWAERTV